MDFEPLLNEPVVSCKKFNSIASNVWEVSTLDHNVIIRTSAVYELEKAPWTWGCYNLFGIDVRKIENLTLINDALRRHSQFKFPQVLQTSTLDNKTYAVMEKLTGDRFQLKSQPAEVVERFAVCLGQLHSVQYDRFGTIDGSFSYSPAEFLPRLMSTMKNIVQTYFPNIEQVYSTLTHILANLSSVPVPKYGTFVMLDMDERQFIADRNEIACVDTEGYAIGPCEFDLIALEYSLDQKTADAFGRGYNSVRPLPQLEQCRMVYRFLAWLMEIKGPVDLDSWMDHAHLLQ